MMSKINDPIQSRTGIAPAIREEFILRDQALSGDMKWRLSPATLTTPATAAGFTRDVLIELTNADNERHTWYTASIASGVSVADTSTAGTASITSNTLNIVNGRAVVTITGDAAQFAAGETDTLTVAALTLLGYTVSQATSVETFS